MPSPVPSPQDREPSPTPDPAPTPSPEAEPTPADTNAGGEAHAPSPPAQPITVPAPVPKTSRRSATEARLAAAAICQAHSPDCDWIATYSSLEKASIKRALQATTLEPDPEPWGKVIGTIRIINEPVFAEKNWLTFLNVFHVTTRAQNIRNEMTIGEGEVWDDERVLETQRRLKDPLYTSIVVVMPVKSADPGKVDMLVVTRDVWSLRLNTKYAIQDCGGAFYALWECTLTDLTVSLSENNFLGRRKTLAFGTNMDLGAFAVGPLYIDKNLLGKHYDFRFRVEKVFTRRSLDVVSEDGETRSPTGDPKGIQDGGGLRAEGTTATASLSLPLWALAAEWGGGVSFSYRNTLSRQYYFTGLRGYDNPDTLAVEMVPREYRVRAWSGTAAGQRQWGKEFKQQFEAGYRVSSYTPSVLSHFALDPALEQAFRDDVFPRTEVVSSPFLEWSFFQAKYGMVRNIDTYELSEDIRFGPNGSAGITQSLKSLGSDYRFTRPSATFGWTFSWGPDGFVRVSGGGQLRIQSKNAIDNTATGQVRAATPTVGMLRFIGQVQMETRWDDQQNQFYGLGSDSGLRAYRINQVIGDRRFLAQFETRSVPYPFWVLRVGGVLFYEGGGAASSFGTMRYLHDVGFGMRVLIPQSSRELFRFDLAFPLATAPGTPAGQPRFIAGFDSYF